MHSITLFYLKSLAPVFLIIMISCGEKTDKKKEALLIKDLQRATNLIGEKNTTQYQRLKIYYKKDTTRKEIKNLYEKLTRVRSLKEDYKNNILKPEVDIELLSKQFSVESLSLLTTEERNSILKSFKDSPLVNTSIIKEMNGEVTIPYELSLEAEMITQEMYRLVLKDFSETQKGFDWEVFW